MTKVGTRKAAVVPKHKAAFSLALRAAIDAGGFRSGQGYAMKIKSSSSSVSRWCDQGEVLMPSLSQLNAAVKPFSPVRRVEVIGAYFSAYPNITGLINEKPVEEIDICPTEIKAILKRFGKLASDFKPARDFLVTMGRMMCRPQIPDSDPHAKRRIKVLFRGFFAFLRLGSLTDQEFKRLEEVERK